MARQLMQAHKDALAAAGADPAKVSAIDWARVIALLKAILAAWLAANPAVPAPAGLKAAKCDNCADSIDCCVCCAAHTLASAVAAQEAYAAEQAGP